MMKKFFRSVGVCVLSECILSIIWNVGEMIRQGPKEKKNETMENTKVDWKGNVILGMDDYQIL